MQLTMGGIEVTEDEHFLCQNVPHDDSRNIIVNKKSASNGATLGLNRFNISQLLGVGTSSDRVWDTEIDESLNRLYIIGESSTPYFSGYVLCVDLTTLAPVTSFGSMGVLSIASKKGKGTGKRVITRKANCSRPRCTADAARQFDETSKQNQ